MPTNKKKHSKKKNNNRQKVRSVSELVQAADRALLIQDAEQAIGLYTAALVLATTNDATAAGAGDGAQDHQAELLAILEKRAQAKLSLSDQQGALEDYQEALSSLQTTTDPDGLERKAGFYLYVGQLSEGIDALNVYQRGISCLQESLDMREKAVTTKGDSSSPDQNIMIRDDDEEDEKTDPISMLRETRRQLAASYCTVAELFLTDLCYEENAEEECESFVNQALRLTDDCGEPIVDALQVATSLRLSQKRGLEAVGFILRAFETMKVGCQALASLVGVGGDSKQASELLELDSVQSLPSFEFRCQTAKLLLECAAVLKDNNHEDDPRRNQCIQGSTHVLVSLLAENDEVVEIWFLMGEAFVAFNPPNKELATYYWERSKQMLLSVQESLEQQVAEAGEEEEEDFLQRQLDEVTCQLEDVSAKLNDLHDGEVQPMEDE